MGRIESKHKELARCVAMACGGGYGTGRLVDGGHRPDPPPGHDEQKHAPPPHTTTACAKACGTEEAAGAAGADRSLRPCSCRSRHVCSGCGSLHSARNSVGAVRSLSYPHRPSTLDRDGAEAAGARDGPVRRLLPRPEAAGGEPGQQGMVVTHPPVNVWTSRRVPAVVGGATGPSPQCLFCPKIDRRVKDSSPTPPTHTHSRRGPPPRPRPRPAAPA